MKKSILILLGALFCFHAFSQFKAGVHGGLVMSNAKIQTGIADFSSDFKPGPMGGLIFGLEIGESQFALLSEINLTNKGMKFKGTQDFLGQPTTITGRAYVYYLEVPVQLLYYTDLWDGNIFLGGGPYGAMGLRGLTKTKYHIDGQSAVADVKTEFGSGYEQMKRYDYGFTGLIGYKLGFGSYLKVFYSQGLANLSNTIDTKYTNRCVGVCFGYFFGSGR